jgi:hypothetical protein
MLTATAIPKSTKLAGQPASNTNLERNHIHAIPATQMWIDLRVTDAALARAVAVTQVVRDARGVRSGSQPLVVRATLHPWWHWHDLLAFLLRLRALCPRVELRASPSQIRLPQGREKGYPSLANKADGVCQNSNSCESGNGLAYITNTIPVTDIRLWPVAPSEVLHPTRFAACWTHGLNRYR